MIHVDVAPHPDQRGHPHECLVQTSVDGAEWATQYVHSWTAGQDPERPRRDAEATARVFANGCRFAGATVRMTSHGYTLLAV